MTSDVHHKLMQLLEVNPGMSRCDAARELGVSLGKVNYCLQALVKNGWIKATHFKNSQHKAAYTGQICSPFLKRERLKSGGSFQS